MNSFSAQFACESAIAYAMAVVEMRDGPTTYERNGAITAENSVIALADRIIAERERESVALRTAEQSAAQVSPDKRTLYRTAKATIACAYFAAGDYVGVAYQRTDANNVDWYEVTSIGRDVTWYPSHHLTDFCL